MRVFWLPALVVLVDQATKLLVHSTMYQGESIPIIGRLFQFTYTQNPGMAFGLTLGSKPLLTLFSVAASVAIAFYLWHVRNGPRAYVLGLALILGGAFGNAIDRVFYGVWFGECWPSPPGSERLLYGCVVDFVHLTIWSGEIAGRYISLFPIGNIADLAILGGVALVLIGQGAYQKHLAGERRAASAETPVAEAPPAPEV